MRLALTFAAALAMLAGCGGSGSDALVLTSTQGPVTFALHIGSTIVGDPATIRLLITQNGHPVVGDAWITWSMDNMPMTDSATLMTPGAPGTYQQRAFVFSMSGRWRAHVLVRVKNRTIGTATLSVVTRD